MEFTPEHEPTKEMIEVGAKAAYDTVFDGDGWPEVGCSVSADYFRAAARNCYIAMVGAKG